MMANFIDDMVALRIKRNDKLAEEANRKRELRDELEKHDPKHLKQWLEVQSNDKEK